MPQYKTSQTTDDRQTDRGHSVPKARPIVRSAKNVTLNTRKIPAVAAAKLRRHYDDLDLSTQFGVNIVTRAVLSE